MEGEVGYFRRNHLVPVPRVKDLAELNALFLDGCRQDRQRKIAGKELAVDAAMEIERLHLLPLAEEGASDGSLPTDRLQVYIGAVGSHPKWKLGTILITAYRDLFGRRETGPSLLIAIKLFSSAIAEPARRVHALPRAVINS